MGRTKKAKLTGDKSYDNLTDEEKQIIDESSDILAKQTQDQQKLLQGFGPIDFLTAVNVRAAKLRKDEGDEDDEDDEAIRGQKRPAAEISTAEVLDHNNENNTRSSQETDLTLPSYYASGLSTLRAPTFTTSGIKSRATLSTQLYQETPTMSSIVLTASHTNGSCSLPIDLLTSNSDQLTFLNPLGKLSFGSCLTEHDCSISDALEEKLKFRTPRAKGHLGKRPNKTSLGVYVTDNNRENALGPLSIERHLEIITMLVYYQASKEGYFGETIEKRYFLSISAKLLANESSWEFNGILQPELCALIFSSPFSKQYVTKWSGLIFSLQTCVKQRLNCLDGGRYSILLLRCFLFPLLLLI